LNQINEELRSERLRHAKELEEKDSRIGKLEKELLAWEHSSTVLIGDANEVALKKANSFTTSVKQNGSCSPKSHIGSVNPLTGKVKSQTSKGDSGPQEVTQIDASPYDIDSDPAVSENISESEGCEERGAAADDADKTDSDQSGDDAQAAAPMTEETRKSLTKRIEQMEENNRRLLSRLKFLDGRLETKEEAIKRLNSRIEVTYIGYCYRSRSLCAFVDMECEK
jgi:predicted RNase H-like nuclease (RuvC/YqgF family)